MLFSPSCDCCDEGVCIAYEDDFSGDKTGWTDQSGTTSIAGGKLTASAAAVSLSNTAVPDTGPLYVEADLTFDDIGDVLGLVLCWTDADNYLYATIQVSGDLSAATGILRLYQVFEGTPTELDSKYVVAYYGNVNTMRLCYHPADGSYGAIVTAQVGSPTVKPIVRSLTDVPNGRQGGVILVTVTANGYWDDYQIGHHYPTTKSDGTCGNCACESDLCAEQTMQKEVTITIADVSGDGGDCDSDCGALNGNFVLTCDQNINQISLEVARWSESFGLSADAGCPWYWGVTFQLSITLEAGDYILRLKIYWDFPTPALHATSTKNLGTSLPACWTMSESFSGFSADECDTSNATASASA